uniref:Uncharacterized protein n=1 Tax=Siphoviridae sp. ctzpQ31 TaxID=2823613 RepID=A0A8S5L881_9CAUD|nr:MAG TPA: hypothetical protein [Siphoviridae sp. ctzpQ31]DAY03672.1 MAG TPA: hypothetical protein [Bacteriophage sp.]
MKTEESISELLDMLTMTILIRGYQEDLQAILALGIFLL